MSFPYYSEWPEWLKYVVMLPHALLGFFATWFWWPKDAQGWRRFGFVAGYLLVFFLVMRYVFRA